MKSRISMPTNSPHSSLRAVDSISIAQYSLLLVSPFQSLFQGPMVPTLCVLPHYAR